MATVLWIDNDRVYLWPRVARLEAEGHQVVRAYTLSDASARLESELDRWDLVIIDVMMNVREEEEKEFPPSETDSGHRAGLVFYERWRDRLEQADIGVAVLTIRQDEGIMRDFIRAGLPEDRFRRKLDVADTRLFSEWVCGIIGRDNHVAC